MKLCRDLSDLVVYTNSVAAQDIVDDGKAVGECWGTSFSCCQIYYLLLYKEVAGGAGHCLVIQRNKQRFLNG